MTERDMQHALFRYLRASGEYLFPNTSWVGEYEADMLRVTKSRYAYEYEIKLSLSDFRADLRKVEKHYVLATKNEDIPSADSWGGSQVRYMPHPDPQAPHRHRVYPGKRPKGFSYVIHGFEIPDGELPAYAGLYRVDAPSNAYERPRVVELVKPPLLQTVKLSERQLIRLLLRVYNKYWWSERRPYGDSAPVVEVED